MVRIVIVMMSLIKFYWFLVSSKYGGKIIIIIDLLVIK